MKKTMLALAATAAIAIGTMTAPQPAQARCFGCAVGLGVLGGVAAGAIIGSAIANHPGYVYYEGYDGPPPMQCDGYWARRRMYDGYGNFVGWSRPHWFCR
jgi:hypothetical protein